MKNIFTADQYEPDILNLTLSCLLKLDTDSLSPILKVQDELLNNVICSDSIGEGRIYRYEPDSLHFSIINFTCETLQRRQFETKYRNLSNSVLREATELLDEFRQWQLSAEKLYINRQGSNKAISISVILENRNREQLMRNLGSLMELHKLESDDQALKFYKENNNFAINIVRFFRQPTDEEADAMISRIESINNTSAPIRVKIHRLSVIISDNYLSNEIPILKAVPL